MPSPRDQCYEDAVSAYEDATGNKLGLEFQKPWLKDGRGNWAPAPEGITFGNIIGSILKTLGLPTPPPERPVAVRYPDLTMTRPDGSKIVIDNKFTDQNGNPDPWRSQVNRDTKGTQRSDYNEINQQQTEDPNAVDLALDKYSCHCPEGDPPGETVGVPDPFPFRIPDIDPFEL